MRASHINIVSNLRRQYQDRYGGTASLLSDDDVLRIFRRCSGMGVDAADDDAMALCDMRAAMATRKRVRMMAYSRRRTAEHAALSVHLGF
jgi:hypothetical protein